MSLVGEVYNALKFFNNTTGYAVGNGGLVKRIAMASAPFGLINVTGPAATDMSAVFFLDKDNGFVAGPNGKVFFTKNASAAATWTQVTTGISTGFSKIFVNNMNMAGFLTTSGQLYKFVGGVFSNTGWSGNFTDMTHTGSTLYLFNAASYNVLCIGYSATDFSLVALTLGGNPNGTVVYNLFLRWKVRLPASPRYIWLEIAVISAGWR